jgi:hypothetical protein
MYYVYPPPPIYGAEKFTPPHTWGLSVSSIWNETTKIRDEDIKIEPTRA